MTDISHPPIPIENDELGAHVSVAGGPQTAPERVADIGAVCLQLFTKQANRWAEPDLERPDIAERFARYPQEVEQHGIRTHGSHDSYLINLSSPDPALWELSLIHI